MLSFDLMVLLLRRVLRRAAPCIHLVQTLGATSAAPTCHGSVAEFPPPELRVPFSAHGVAGRAQLLVVEGLRSLLS